MDNNVGQRIRELRKKNGLSQMELANKLGVAITTLKNWEYGHHNPKAVVIKKCAEIFHVDERYLLYGANNDYFAASANRAPVILPISNNSDCMRASELTKELAGLFAGGEISGYDKDVLMLTLERAFLNGKTAHIKLPEIPDSNEFEDNI